MRVLHVTKKFPDMLGGDASYVDALVRNHRAAGHEAFVAAPNCTVLRRGPDVRPFGPPTDVASLDRLGPHRLRLLRDLRRALPDLLGWFSPDLVHAHSADFGFAVSRSPALRVPVVLTCHSLSFPSLPRWNWKGALERWVLRRGRWRAITVLHAGAVRALAELGLRASAISGGVDGRLFAPRADGDAHELRLLFVGRLEPEKGIDVLLDAIGRVRAPVRVSIVGEGSLHGSLETTVRARGLADRVAFEGPIVAREAMAARYRQADALVLPSRTEGGLPLALLEAWASGLPAIVTEACPIHDLDAADAAIVVPVEDPSSLGEAVERLATGPELRGRMGLRAREIALERFSWESAAGRFLKLYETVLR